MDIQTMNEQLSVRISRKELVAGTISQPRLKSNDIKRIKLKPVEIKNQYFIQFEYQYEHILKH